LSSITLEEGIASLGDFAFESATVTQLKIPNSVHTLGRGVFKNNTKLQSVTLSDNLTIVPAELFSGNTSLHTANLAKNIISIEERAFFNASSLRSITLPETLANIGTSAFEGLVSLSTFEVPSSVRIIGDRALSGNNKLLTLYLPNKLSVIGVNVLEGSSLLSTIFYCGNLTGLPVQSVCTDAMKKKIEEEAYQQEKAIRDSQRNLNDLPNASINLVDALNAVTESANLVTDSANEALATSQKIIESIRNTQGTLLGLEKDLQKQVAALSAQMKVLANLALKIAKKAGG
jgi:methyl-accepting chemotaxis protein